jgi:ATP-binding protein involved in chromosome partitioning
MAISEPDQLQAAATRRRTRQTGRDLVGRSSSRNLRVARRATSPSTSSSAIRRSRCTSRCGAGADRGGAQRSPGRERQREASLEGRRPRGAARRAAAARVKNIVAVASGKGGVGKSTTAVNLALALAAEGATVGILDADIYGPSQPMMMGIVGRPESADGKTMEPMENYGVQVMSIGFLIEPDNPMIWRGPMATQALEQLLRQTHWSELDYLIVDMPPGTGDIQLTLSQRVPLTGAVIVTTPQDIALLDARKGIKMFEKVGVPILGIVENMAVHVCEKCGHVEHIFGEEGGKRLAAEYKMDYLGALRSTSRSGSRPTAAGRASSAIRRARSPGCTRASAARWR